MSSSHTDPNLNGEQIFALWIKRFADAVEARVPQTIGSLFLADGYWKDILSFTWQHRFFAGPAEIGAAFAERLELVAPRDIRVAPTRTRPHIVMRAKREVVEGYFDFNTVHGHGAAFVRLMLDPIDSEPRAWVVLTTLQSLHGFEERAGTNRPSGDKYSRNATGRTWHEDRAAARQFADRDPEVIVIGAGHAGLVAAARLNQMGVDTLVVEKLPRVGDVWRNRYKSLTLHNEIMANHLPYLAFPKTWPVWLTKDHLADWLESYAEFLELNVWTSTLFEGANYDNAAQRWTVQLAGTNGASREITCRHIVVASGVSGSVPHRPQLPGLEDFAGEILHSSEFFDGADYEGRNAIVVGTGNSAHDVTQELVVKGANKVAMLQRGPTCVISLKPGAEMIYKIYDEDRSVEDVDLMAASIPYPVLAESYRAITRKAAGYDRDLLVRLNSAGFKTYFGSDGSGFQMMYMRGEGGYYIDVGCSDLIATGRVKVIQYDDIGGFVAEGLKGKDGCVTPCDLVVLATGFKNMQEYIRCLFGDEVAERLGPIWGFDEHFQMRNMWRRTAQPGLWITGGALLDSRLFSRFMAIEIKAELENLTPAAAA